MKLTYLGKSEEKLVEWNKEENDNDPSDWPPDTSANGPASTLNKAYYSLYVVRLIQTKFHVIALDLIIMT